MKNRKAVIFDMGGVLVDLDIEGCKAAFKSSLGYSNIDNIIDACHQKGIYGDLEEALSQLRTSAALFYRSHIPARVPLLWMRPCGIYWSV